MTIPPNDGLSARSAASSISSSAELLVRGILSSSMISIRSYSASILFPVMLQSYDFITRLPDGFDTVLTGDGANLSQGQRQLLSIARAAIKDAPVMILDEATSSIDTRTELLVQKGTDKLMEGRTVFVIAHRLSTVKNSNAIMVLDHGHIIERGNHDSLIAKKGTYYQLYTDRKSTRLNSSHL